MQFRAGCKYRRDEWMIEVYYDEDDRFVAFNPRTGDIVEVSTLPADDWVQTDAAWRMPATR